MMCVDLMNVERDVHILEEAGVDYLHVDVMDNHFVPNITLSLDFIKSLKKITDIPLDIHLMIEKPGICLNRFDFCGKDDVICVHYESEVHIQRTLSTIRSLGVQSSIALNPGTPVCMLEDLLDDIDIVLIMTVNPGYAGQKLVRSTLNKIKKAKEMLSARHFNRVRIEVDGNVSFENAAVMRKLGADIYVGGTSSIFEKGSSIKTNTERLRSIIQS